MSTVIGINKNYVYLKVTQHFNKILIMKENGQISYFLIKY